MSKTRVPDIPLKPSGYTLVGKKIMVHDLSAPLTANTVLVDISDITFSLPNQTNNSGKFLSTDGSNPVWVELPDSNIDIDSLLPDQTNNEGRVLMTDGVAAYWGAGVADGSVGNLDVVLTEGNESDKSINLGTGNTVTDDKGANIVVGANNSVTGGNSVVTGVSNNVQGSNVLVSGLVNEVAAGVGSGIAAGVNLKLNKHSSAFGARASTHNTNEVALGGGNFIGSNGNATNGHGKHSHYIGNFLTQGTASAIARFEHDTTAKKVFQRFTIKVYAVDNSGATDRFFIREFTGHRVGNTLGEFTEYSAASSEYENCTAVISLDVNKFLQITLTGTGSTANWYRWSVDFTVNEINVL